MQRRRRYLIYMVLVLLVLVPGTMVHAQNTDLRIRIQPRYGAANTVVTIFGSGAPPHSPVDILYAPFSPPVDCRAHRGANVASTVTTDSRGQFTTTHQAVQSDVEQEGMTYHARLADGPMSGATSNLECFVFADGPEIRYFPDTATQFAAGF